MSNKGAGVNADAWIAGVAAAVIGGIIMLYAKDYFKPARPAVKIISVDARKLETNQYGYTTVFAKVTVHNDGDAAASMCHIIWHEKGLDKTVMNYGSNERFGLPPKQAVERSIEHTFDGGGTINSEVAVECENASARKAVTHYAVKPPPR